jgi:PAS domain S-box-containing protein
MENINSLSDIKLLHSERIHRSLVDECPFGIFRVNPATGCFEQANAMLLRISGYTAEQLRIIYAPHLYANPGDRERFLALLRESGSVRDFETYFRTNYGSIVRVSLSAYLSPDPDTGEQFIHGYVQDITRQRELEAQLSHSHRMEAVGRLAGGVAHDFNNITQSISLSCELALQKPLTPALESKLLDIMRQTTRAADITRQLLAFSRRQVLQPRVVDLNDCVSKAVPLLTRTVGVDVALELKLDETADHVFFDPEQLTLVLMHLADNAREAMPTGGTLRIATSRAHGKSAPGSAPAAPCTVLTVSDTGLGMDEATLRHIFEPFFSTKKTTHTTGLGLPTVHGIISQSKGHIECESTPGNGAIFRIYLPAAHAPSSAEEKLHPAAISSGILLAEDDPLVNKYLARALEQAGFSVQATSNGEEAESAFDPQRHHVLVTDIVMPKLDGVELTRRLRQHFPTLPVVLISGFSEEIRVLQDLPQRSIIYLQKPFPVSRLVAAINKLLAQQTAERSPP